MPKESLPVEQILARIGEAAYRWSIAEDRIEWSDGAAAVFGLVSMESLATGSDFAGLVEKASGVSRSDHILTSSIQDPGDGVSYQIEYSVRPFGPDGPLLWIEDCGRWYADGGRQAARAEGVVRVVNERHAREERLAFLSRYDEETGLFNRSHLLDRLDEAIEQSLKLRVPSAFLVVAIDNLLLIHEAYGMHAADLVLAAVAQRIRGRLRESDVIGRFAPDRIGILLNHCEENEMSIAAERFIAAVGEDVVTTDDVSISVTISIGAVAIPRHARRREEAIERALETLALVGASGSGRFMAFASSLARAEERKDNAELSRQLVGALAEGRLKLAFQPVIDIATRQPVYHEALLRLVQPDGAVAPAAQIVPLAERLGLSRLFDLAVLDLVFGTLAQDAEAVLSVNVAPETAAGPDWLAKLADGLSRIPGAGRRLIVELTEVSAIRNLDDMTKFVARLHDLGVRLAIDDFGAGYTSFRSLRALKVDIVKIDGSFVENLASSPEDQLFVRHLAGLASELGIETVAEWVTDEESVRMLAGWGVQRLQGDAFGGATFTPVFG
ncbi:bifunctional diguanylate cyclase/phosphodiesterase [Kaistia algarum]|uniref:bifunctional diguanylate cyclase/phosphodiesterase n=1 Tax=Kaistia algarum TaxID=2083279 RepID=UPI000CE85E97|nr:bifunctional diguanylate cyclase/phosphodiesterase [Kaistia algarum]MCX5514468.1 bifunctional diguanylate cyclase/phosphodiesterase [Kaistia algarum]